MRIAYIVQYYPPHPGGLEQVAERQAQSAVKAGHAVSVTTFAVRGASRGTRDEAGVSVTRVRGWHVFDRRFGIPFCLGGVGLVRAVCRAVRTADIVHVHDVFYISSWVAYLAARWYRKPLVLTQHVAMVAYPSMFVMRVEEWVYAVWGMRLFHASEAIIVYNRIVADFLEERGVPTGKVIEVRNGIDTKRFTPASGAERAMYRRALGLPAEKPMVLFVGRLVPKKGYRELFDARSDAYELVFAGPGAVPGSWRLTPGVHVLGERTQEELLLLYRAADLFVAPSRGELFTLVMQEACACGLPVVTTDESAYAGYDIDRELVTFCEPTASALRTQLERLAGDRELRERMGTYARSIACRWFDWDTNVRRTLDLYEEVYARAQGPARVVVTTSWDDGHVLDLKLAEFLRRYGIRGTFYVAPENEEIAPNDRLSAAHVCSLAEEFEIGAHTLTHRHLTKLSDAEAWREIAGSKRALEALLGTPVASFCYPAGKYRARHARMVHDAGFYCARTVRRFTISSGTDRWRLATSVHTYDHWLDAWKLLWFVRFNVRAFLRLYRRWDLQAIALFNRVRERGGVFHLWGHSLELEYHDAWERLERVLRHIGGRTDVTYVTNRELV